MWSASVQSTGRAETPVWMEALDLVSQVLHELCAGSKYPIRRLRLYGPRGGSLADRRLGPLQNEVHAACLHHCLHVTSFSMWQHAA